MRRTNETPRKMIRRDGRPLKRRFEVISPVHDGGVAAAGEADPVTPVRTAAIRGQLRFWWRATCGVERESVADMLAAETRIWGAASSPGAVALAITEQPVAKTMELPGIGEPLGYGGFGLRTSAGKLGMFEGECQLVLSGPGLADAGIRAEVERALDAWLTFGGIGGRTRRGFGAVASAEGECDPEETLRRLRPGSTLPDTPSLSGARLVLAPGRSSTGRAAQQKALKLMMDFRQKPGLARREGGKRPGRSFWPEADAIRRIADNHKKGHEPEHPVHQKAPRAEFGLPLIIQFKDKDRGDPRQHEIKPKDSERLASPILLRPIRIKKNSYRAAALLLDGIRARDLALETKGAGLEAGLTEAEAAQIRPLAGNADPLDAFLDFFSRGGT